MNFRIYCESEEFPPENVRALERAMDGFVSSDIPLAVEFAFADEGEIRRLRLYPPKDGVPSQEKTQLYGLGVRTVQGVGL